MGLLEHLAGGDTTVCRCWSVRRRDGRVLGFTDHDRDLAFDGITFRADTGLTAEAMQQSSGLALDNGEAFGALTDVALREVDIAAGRFDGAEVEAWHVNWSAPEERMLQFRGTIGEITRTAGSFRAELHGLSHALNRPQGFVYQAPCSAVLGDARCGVDLRDGAFGTELTTASVDGGKSFGFEGLDRFAPGWFVSGRLDILDGPAAGLGGVIRRDEQLPALRRIDLWEELGIRPADATRVRLRAGCDKRAETCRAKFDNYRSFRGFPDLPGEDWLMAYPRDGEINDGGSLTR